MKKIFCAIMFFFALCSMSQASVQKFGNFRVDVPNGWQGGLQGSTLVVKNNRTTASVTVSFNKTDGESLSDIVENIYVQMDGRDLEQDDDGDYSFNFMDSAGAESVALITGDNDIYLAISLSGFDDEKLQSDFNKILDSIEWED